MDTRCCAVHEVMLHCKGRGGSGTGIKAKTGPYDQNFDHLAPAHTQKNTSPFELRPYIPPPTPCQPYSNGALPPFLPSFLPFLSACLPCLLACSPWSIWRSWSSPPPIQPTAELCSFRPSRLEIGAFSLSPPPLFCVVDKSAWHRP